MSLIRWIDEPKPNTLGSFLALSSQDFAYIQDVQYTFVGGGSTSTNAKSGSFKDVAAIRQFLLNNWPAGAAIASANITKYHKDPEEPLNYQKMHKSYWHIKVNANGTYTTGEGFVTEVETKTKVTQTTSPSPEPAPAPKLDSKPRRSTTTLPRRGATRPSTYTRSYARRLGELPGGSAGGSAAWTAYFKALRSNLIDSWQEALVAYKTLKSVRETLELPFIMDQPPSGSETKPTAEQQAAWSPELEQFAVNAQKMVQIIVGACGDVLDGKRKVAHDPTHGFGIELLPTDELRVGSDNGLPVLLSKNSDVVNVPGAVGFPWVPVLVAGVITTGIVAYAVVKAVDALKTVAEEKTMQTIALRDAKLVESGKATPEQVAAMDKALFTGAKELQKAKGDAASGPKPAEWTPLVKTVVWGGVAIAGLVIVAKLLPSGGIHLGSSRTANPHTPNRQRSSNPRGGGVDTVASEELQIYIWNESDLSPMGPGGRGHSVMINLLKKMGKGTYRSERAPQAWKYVVDDAAKRYVKEYGETPFSSDTRWAAAAELSRNVEDKIRAGEFDYLLKEAGYARFDLDHEEAEALRTWIAPRYRSGEILWDEWNEETKMISISAARRAYKATRGDGGNLGTVPLAGGSLARKIDKLWDDVAYEAV